MEVSLSDAKARLTDLVRQAEAGEDVVLTRHGQPVARIVASTKKTDAVAKRRLIEELQKSAAEKMTPGPSAARSQDFLYDEFGLPK